MPVTKQKQNSKYITQKEIDSIREFLGDVDLALFETLLFTGVRISEVKSLIKAVEQNNNAVQVILKPNKNNLERKIPIKQCMFELLGSGISLETKSLKQRINRWGLDFSPHDLRATFITRLIEKGIDAVVVQHLIGHKDIKSTLKYVRLGHINQTFLYDLAYENMKQYDFEYQSDLINALKEKDKIIAKLKSKLGGI